METEFREHPQHEGPYDPVCGRTAENIRDIVEFARENGMSPAEYVRKEEGTYNPENGHFLCDECFIKEEERRGARLAHSDGTPWRCP